MISCSAMYNGEMSINWQNIKLVLFDFDGTLNETDDQYVQKLAGLLGFGQRIFPRWDITALSRSVIMAIESPGNAILGIPDKIGVDGLWDQTVNKLGISRSRRPRQFQPVKEVIPLIKAASQQRKIGLVSVRGASVLEDFIEYAGIRENISVVVHGLSTKNTKPNPDPILFACQQMGVAPGECAMVGDTTVDIIAARRAGASSVGVLCGFGTRNEIIREEADLILSSTADLLHYLE